MLYSGNSKKNKVHIHIAWISRTFVTSQKMNPDWKNDRVDESVLLCPSWVNLPLSQSPYDVLLHISPSFIASKIRSLCPLKRMQWLMPFHKLKEVFFCKRTVRYAVTLKSWIIFRHKNTNFECMFCWAALHLCVVICVVFELDKTCIRHKPKVIMYLQFPW